MPRTSIYTGPLEADGKLPSVDVKKLLRQWAESGHVPILPQEWSWFPCLGCSPNGRDRLCNGDHWNLYPTDLLDDAQRLYAALLLDQPSQQAKPPSEVATRLRAQADLTAQRRRDEE